MTTIVLGVKKVINEGMVNVDAFPINWKMLLIFGTLLMIVLLSFYTYIVIDVTKGVYLLKNSESNLKILSEKNKSLEISFAESSFLGHVNSTAKNLNFEKSTSVKYIQIPDNAVAMSK